MTVDELIARIQAAGGTAQTFGGCYADPRPLAAADLAELLAPDGGPLPPSLRRWLAFDASWLPLFDDDGPPRWRLTTVSDFVDGEIAEVAQELEGIDWWDPDDARDSILEQLATLPGGADLEEAPAILLPPSASQAHLWVFHRAPGAVELPVLGYEKEQFWRKYPSFGGFLAHYFAGIEDAP